MRRPRLVLSAVVAFAVLMSLLAESNSAPAGASSERGISASPPPRWRSGLPQGEFCGVSSCSAASCHGGGNAGAKGSEFTTWVEGDPHARAYRVLFNEESRRIVQRLNAGKKEPLQAAPEELLCLKCHALPTVEPERIAVPPPSAASDRRESVPSRSVFHAGGVSCEGCHGPASGYLTAHYQAGWKSLSVQQKAERYGLWPTKDLAFRVTVCTSCHTGNENQEVNHDLIAAGHPRLLFEYTSYHFHPAYRKHWTENSYGKDFEARAWLIGQIAEARSAVELLESRSARAAHDAAPWPELSAYSCYACHKNLGPSMESWGSLSKMTRKLGSPAWESWSFALLPVLTKASTVWLDTPEAPSFQEVTRLREMMEKSASPSEVRTQSVKARQELEDCLERLQQGAAHSLTRPATAAQVDRLFTVIADNALTSDGSQFNGLDWDGATQHFLAFTALRSCRRRLETSPTDPADRLLGQLREQLSFPNRYNSPHDSSPKALLESFRAIQHLGPQARSTR